MEYKGADWNSKILNSDSVSDVGNLSRRHCLLFLVTNFRYCKNFNCEPFPVMKLGFINSLKRFSLLALISKKYILIKPFFQSRPLLLGLGFTDIIL